MRQTIDAELFGEMIETLEYLGLPVEVAHWESAPGSAEIVLRYAEGIKAADDAIIYKTMLKAFAQRRGLLVSFRPRSHETHLDKAAIYISHFGMMMTNPCFTMPGHHTV